MRYAMFFSLIGVFEFLQVLFFYQIFDSDY